MCECVCLSSNHSEHHRSNFQPSTASNRYVVVAILRYCYLWRACVCVWNIYASCAFLPSIIFRPFFSVIVSSAAVAAADVTPATIDRSENTWSMNSVEHTRHLFLWRTRFSCYVGRNFMTFRTYRRIHKYILPISQMCVFFAFSPYRLNRSLFLIQLHEQDRSKWYRKNKIK